MPRFASYLHPHTCFTSKPLSQIRFVGHSLPHLARVREALSEALVDYPALPGYQADYEQYRRVHTQDYLDKLARMAADESVEQPPKLSIECAGLHYCLPGYLYGLGGMLQAINAMQTGVLERAYCFSLPGHHAHADWGHGYCLLNPQAAAVRYAQERGFTHVLIIDWDLHHFSGYDSHRDDCGEGITNWDDQDLERLTRYVLTLAKKSACPILSVHGGGYNLPVTLSAALRHVTVLANEP